MGNSKKTFLNQSLFIAEAIAFRVMQYKRVRKFVLNMGFMGIQRSRILNVEIKNIKYP
jgi:hypothetical protein